MMMILTNILQLNYKCESFYSNLMTINRNKETKP